MCELCDGTKVVHNEIMAGVMVTGPCPNCTEHIHNHYEHELENVIKHERQGKKVAR